QLFAAAALLISWLMPKMTASLGWPAWADYVCSFAISVALIGAASYALYWSGFQKFTRDLLGSFTLSLGFLFIGQGALLAVFGGAPRVTPRLLSGDVAIGSGVVSAQRLLIVFVAIAVTAGLQAFVRRSRIGHALRAVADDHEAAMLQGIRYRTISSIGFV